MAQHGPVMAASQHAGSRIDMLKIFGTPLIIASGIMLAAPAFADTAANSAREVAEAWLDAYQRQDFAAMTALMTEETVFVDPTSFSIEAVTERIEWRGPDAITSGIAAWGMDHGVYEIERSYEASDRVIFIGRVDVVYGQGEAAQTFRYPITTIVTVDGDHVVEHRDYTDFAGATRVQPTH
jgi:limonene-1,2-epoxide hydrolase